MLKIILKALFTIILLGLFTRYFGWPSINKYRQKVTFFSEEKWLFDKSKPPAISVYISNADIGGWKRRTNNFSLELSKAFCSETANLTYFIDCINNNSYEGGELFQHIKNGIFGIRERNIRYGQTNP